MSKLRVKEAYINATEGYRYGDSGWFEPYATTKKELFKDLQEEFGRCTSKVYIDIPMGDGTYHTVTCGWHFEKRIKYSDSKDSYLQHTWVEHNGMFDN